MKGLAPYKQIPIQFLEDTRQVLKANKKPYRIRFRGPRNTEPMDTRHRYTKQHDCLKQFATSFSIYWR